jgi:replicative DNA helicase
VAEKKDVLREEVYISEAYLTALAWNNPEIYDFYSQEKINSKTFGNPIWGFFFGLGRYMRDKDVKIFDDITTYKYVQELKLEDLYDNYGSYETIAEVIEEVKDKAENFESYYNEVKKYYLLRNLRDLFGDKVIQCTAKYDYHKMNRDELLTYWNDKINKLSLDGDNKFDEQYLLQDIEKSIEEWDKNPSIGLPFYQSKLMTKICTGWDYGHVYIFGGFSGRGKTSFTLNKIILSCIEHKEKLLVICNEQSVDEFRKMLLMTAMGVGTKEAISRQRLNEGNFTNEEKEKLKKAVEWVKNLCDGEDKLITFVFMENYVMEDVKKIIRHYAMRGVRRVLIDTGKPSEGDSSMARWERFAEDFKEIYKLARPNGGGLNLAVWVNVQLADTALTHRFLNEFALGESKKIKNESSVMFLSRPVWDDEYKGEKHELKVYRYVKDELNGGYRKVESTLEKGNDPYYLLFTSKNRRGASNENGQPVLVFKVNFNNNTWSEVGFCQVYNDKNY